MLGQVAQRSKIARTIAIDQENGRNIATLVVDNFRLLDVARDDMRIKHPGGEDVQVPQKCVDHRVVARESVEFLWQFSIDDIDTLHNNSCLARGLNHAQPSGKR